MKTFISHNKIFCVLKVCDDSNCCLEGLYSYVYMEKHINEMGLVYHGRSLHELTASLNFYDYEFLIWKLILALPTLCCLPGKHNATNLKWLYT
jgi:hypothetical protein